VPIKLISYRICWQKCVSNFPLCAEGIAEPFSKSWTKICTNTSSEDHKQASVHFCSHTTASSCYVMSTSLYNFTITNMLAYICYTMCVCVCVTRSFRLKTELNYRALRTVYAGSRTPHEATPVSALIREYVSSARLLSDNCRSNATNLHQFFCTPFLSPNRATSRRRCSRYPPDRKHSARANLRITLLLDEL
jgi:hypothetical protein